MEHIAKLFRALGEPARLRIVSLLARRSLCVSDLQLLLNASQPYVSRHLAFLRAAGLVHRARVGGLELYGLTTAGETQQFVSLVNDLRAWNPTLRMDLERLEQLGVQGTLRADRCRCHSQESSGAGEEAGRTELNASAPFTAEQAA